MYPHQQTPYGQGYPTPPKPNRTPLFIVLGVFGFACVGSIIMGQIHAAETADRQTEEIQSWRQQAAQTAAQPSAAQSAAAPLPYGQPGYANAPQAGAVAPPTFAPTGITANYQDPENQRLARIGLSVAQRAGTLLVVDAAVANSGEPTITVAALNERSTSAETQAVSICMTLMNVETSLAAITRFVINGNGGERLAL
jgi:hypothetical protein